MHRIKLITPRGTFYSKSAEFTPDDIEETKKVLQRATAGELNYINYTDDKGNIMVFGDKLLQESVLIVENESGPL